MSCQIVLYGDIHNSEESAQNYQRSIEVQRPDAVFIEYDEKGEEAEFMYESLQEYVTPGDVFEAFGADLDEYDNPDLHIPMYALSPRKMDAVRERVSGAIDEAVEKGETLGPNSVVLGEEEDKALKSVILNYKGTFGNDANSLSSRIFHSMTHMDSDIHFIDSERSKMFEYGAREIENLPDDPNTVETIYEKARTADEGTNMIELQTQSAMYPNKDIGKGLNEWLEQVDEEIREPEMERQIREGMEENDYDNVAVVTGKGHTAELGRRLEDDFNITMQDLAGKTEEWEVRSDPEEFGEQENQGLLPI